MSDEVRSVEVAAPFRHSAGRLGSHFLATIRDHGQLLGWRTGTPSRVIVPPKDLGDEGQWVPVGPGARLEAYAPVDWLDEIGLVEDEALSGSVLALVTPDGADTAMVARLRVGGAAPVVGMKLVAHFAEQRGGTMTDVWFEPVQS